MKNYTITVNGNVYDVTVEEKGKHRSSTGRCKRTCTKGST